MALFRKRSIKGDPHAEYQCTIRFLDDSEPIVLTFKKDTHGHVLFDNVCNKLNLVEKDYFGLRYVDSEKQRHWLDPLKTVYKQLKGVNPTVLCFRVKFYPADPMKLHEEITRYYLFLQLRRDLHHGRLLCSPSDANLLAAYIIQSEVGDYEAEDHPPGYVTEFKMLPKQNGKMEDQIMELHKTLKDQVPAEAEGNFLKKASSLDTYGVDPHQVKDHKGTQLYLGVTHQGIMTFHGSRRTQLYKWSQIRRIVFEGKMFILHVNVTEEEDASNTKKEAAVISDDKTTSEDHKIKSQAPNVTNEKMVSTEVINEQAGLASEMINEKVDYAPEVTIEQSPAGQEVTIEKSPAGQEVTIEQSPADHEVTIEQSPADHEVTIEKVVPTKIADEKAKPAEVTNEQVAPAEVTNEKVANAEVTDEKVTLAEVTNQKVAPAEVTSEKVAQTEVTSEKVAPAVTIDKVSSNSKQQPIGYKCQTVGACKYLWRCAVEQQLFFTLDNSANPPKQRSGGSLFSRGSKFRFSGRCQNEAYNASQEIKRDEPQFNRSASLPNFTRKSDSKPSLKYSTLMNKTVEEDKKQGYRESPVDVQDLDSKPSVGTIPVGPVMKAPVASEEKVNITPEAEEPMQRSFTTVQETSPVKANGSIPTVVMDTSVTEDMPPYEPNVTCESTAMEVEVEGEEEEEETESKVSLDDQIKMLEEEIQRGEESMPRSNHLEKKGVESDVVENNEMPIGTTTELADVEEDDTASSQAMTNKSSGTSCCKVMMFTLMFILLTLTVVVVVIVNSNINHPVVNQLRHQFRFVEPVRDYIMHKTQTLFKS